MEPIALVLFSPLGLAGLGSAIILAGLIVYAYRTALWRRYLWAELTTFRVQIAAVIKHQRRLEDDTLRLSNALAGEGERHKVDSVLAEVKVLQRLIEQLHAGKSVPSLKIAVDGSTLDDEAILSLIQDQLNTNGVEMVLQPIVRLPQRHHRYYECFSRLRMNERELLAPERYVPIAEQHGLIATIDNLVLIRCVQLLRRLRRGAGNLGFFVNLSPATLADRSFFEDFLALMAENAPLAPSLIFELPQHVLMKADPKLLGDLQRLASLGFRFSLDHVENWDIDIPDLSEKGFRFMKVSAAHLLRLGEEDAARPRTLRRMLDEYGIDLVAVRLERERDLLEVLEYDIDWGQGYLFGEPRPPRPGLSTLQ
ncbi:MAG TPA: EAL domain-containing protein [Dongiaceae bacterium]|jgi:cyclic-di-GMP phosphodiesterase TipF (flagellum assembly factor)|nr:EAL domain-containing protein [Dongiaceae bacterium]